MKHRYERTFKTSDRRSLELNESLFHSANGYIGIRGAFEEGYASDVRSVRGSYMNGVYEIVPMPQAEPLFGLVNRKQTIINVAEVQDIKAYLDGELATPAEEYTRCLDFTRGTSARTFSFVSAKGVKADVRITRLASFKRPNIFMLVYEIATSGPCNITFDTGHNSLVRNHCDPNDPRLASEATAFLRQEGCRMLGDGMSAVSVSTQNSGLGISTVVWEKVPGAETREVLENNDARRTHTLHNATGAVLTRMVSFADSRHCADTEATAIQKLREAKDAGMERIFREQEEYLSSFWDDVGFSLSGDDRLEEAVSFNLFCLLQSAGRDGLSHIAAKGLSGEGYEGHYFWDTEMYVQTIFTLTRPEISKRLLAYRYSILDKARRNAARLGHGKGALYAWRTINGDECSGFFPAGSAQYHINGAIAHAVIQYYEATDDHEFMTNMGLEMLMEISRLWIDTGVFTKRGFEINDVTGPDEYTCIVNNNYYTNACAKFDLRQTARLIREFRAEGTVLTFEFDDAEILEFEKAAELMFLPFDEELGINPQDDSFLNKKPIDLAAIPEDKHPMLLHYHPLFLYRHQVCKQADTILAHLLHPEYSDRSTMERSFRYYEKITTHDSTLSKCIFSIMASYLGLKDEALKYFGSCSETDLRDTHKNTRDGIHTANMGGSYLAITMGFAGLRIKKEGISLAPALPDKWNSYGFSIRYRGSKIHVEVDKDRVIVTTSQPVCISIYGTTYEAGRNGMLVQRLGG